jgi:hypothetical protein
MVRSLTFGYARYRLGCVLQPILQIMLDKALQAHSQHPGLQEPLLSDEELSFFSSQTPVVSQPFTSPTPAPLQLQSQPTYSGQFKIHDPPPVMDSLVPPLLPHDPIASKPLSLPDNYNHLDTFQATFAELSGGWDGLFHEVPQPSYGYTSTSMSHVMQPFGETAMLDDRWASFMHNYNILNDTSERQHPTLIMT